MKCPVFRQLLAFAVVLLAGCRTTVHDYEGRTRDQLSAVAQAYRPHGDKPALPTLNPGSTAADYLRYALLNNPQVEAAFHDWRAAVEAIAPARSLPDPKLTLQADIASTVMSFMPGLMFDVMGRGKRTAMGREAAAGAEVAHREYATALLHSAAEVRNAWLELAFVEDARALHRSAIASTDNLKKLADAAYATGRGMASLEPQVMLQTELAEHHNQHAILSDRLVAAHARFKAALGLRPTDPDPAWPAAHLSATPLPLEDELWQRAIATNPDLGKMRAMVEMAVASVEVAKKSRTPDAAIGAMVDLKASPLMVRPTASVSLPVWRDKIAALIAGAEARRDAAVARLNAGEINLAAELAQMLYMVREADRMVAYVDQTELPSLDRLLATAEAAYQSGMTGASALAEIPLKTAMLRLERLSFLLQRENAITGLLLLTANLAPSEFSTVQN